MIDANARLWEIDHPYYCSKSNYFSNDRHTKYASWPEFLASEGDSDLDMNLVFRWDWNPVEYTANVEELAAFHAKYDDNYRAYTLSIFWVGQRKGIFRCTETSVCRADEHSVREWLTIRAEHLRLTWEPLLTTGRLS